jgi:hypothetical protein
MMHVYTTMMNCPWAGVVAAVSAAKNCSLPAREEFRSCTLPVQFTRRGGQLLEYLSFLPAIFRGLLQKLCRALR